MRLCSSIQSLDAPSTTEHESFDPWGERRATNTLINYRATDTDPFRTSAQDYDRGYTGHEQLDDSGLIHMNGRIYDPELGRMLSPDPYVQVPEYSQNFNRYSYVMNNPLNLTDPSGFSWVGDVFHDVGGWLKENWRTVAVIVVMAVVTWGVGAAFTAPLSGATVGTSTTFATVTATGTSLTATGMAATGGIVGAVGGGLNAAVSGGDVLRGALVGGVQGAIAGGLLHGLGVSAAGTASGLDDAVYAAGHGVLGGAANVAMGGKFQDGFLSAAAGAAATFLPFANGDIVSRTIKSSVVGGTAAEIGGGKFANGAWTAAFQHLLNAELNGAPLKEKANEIIKSINSRYDGKNPVEITLSEYLTLSLYDYDAMMTSEGFIQGLSGDSYRKTVGESFADGTFFANGWAGRMFKITGISPEMTRRFGISSENIYSGSDINYTKFGMIEAVRFNYSGYARFHGQLGNIGYNFSEFIFGNDGRSGRAGNNYVNMHQSLDQIARAGGFIQIGYEISVFEHNR